jgi:uncharacterized tellurite resistance protein B-like protein
MIKSLKEFLLSGLSAGGEDSGGGKISIELCAAVLMLEVSLADSKMDDEEYRLIERAMQQHFGMSKEKADILIETAREEVDHATSLYAFTRHVNETLAPREKYRIIELLWRVAHADAVIDKYEEYYIRKIADLLYVSHADYIKAKHRAAESVAG